jgi:hypothetical protein
MQIIINILHLILFCILFISPFINDCAIKLNSIIILVFISVHFITKYGKCGIINCERFFLKENFKDGFFFKLIKPVISYKNNIFYEKFFNIIILYIIILMIQVYEGRCIPQIMNEISTLFKFKK